MLSAALACLCAPAFAAANLQCDGGLVSQGDAKVQVLKACGEPVYQESRQEERAVRREDEQLGALVERRSTVNVDEWTFNFGPGRFVYTVTFENGRVTVVERGGYGYDPTAVEEAQRYWDGRECKQGGFRIGDRKFDVLAKCGQPLLQEAREEQRVIRIFDQGRKGFREHRVTFLVDEWTYNFGPRRFIYFLRFTAGRLTEIEAGGYGY